MGNGRKREKEGGGVGNGTGCGKGERGMDGRERDKQVQRGEGRRPYRLHTLSPVLEAQCLLIQLIPFTDYFIREKNTAVSCTPKFNKFSRMSSSSFYVMM